MFSILRIRLDVFKAIWLVQVTRLMVWKSNIIFSQWNLHFFRKSISKRSKPNNDVQTIWNIFDFLLIFRSTGLLAIWHCTQGRGDIKNWSLLVEWSLISVSRQQVKWTKGKLNHRSIREVYLSWLTLVLMK